MKNRQKMEELLRDMSPFLESFQSKFVGYFVSLSRSYYKIFSSEDLECVAKEVYSQIINTNLNITCEEESLFIDMRKEGVMIGFLINRAMLYFLENFIKHIQEKEPNNCKHIETMVVSITHFINYFEAHICDRYKLQPIELNFDHKDNFIIGNNIVDIFKKIKKEGKKIQFFNLYKGVPISHSATIVDIDGEDIVFATDAIQEVAMKMDGTAYIMKDSNFTKHIKADIVYNNFFNNTVVLNNFTYLLNMPASQREFVRVHPNVCAHVSLNGGKGTLTKGKLFDLSLHGLGVVSEENHGLFAGAKIDVAFSLPFNDTKEEFLINTSGEILNIVEYSDSYRYCIKIFPKLEEEEKIIQYVKEREEEIVNNLEELLSDYKA
jgi:hypothetical protein